MSGLPLVAIPIKPFEVAKDRLAETLNPATRVRLAQALADHTIEVALESQVEVLILAATEEVAEWADDRGVSALVDDHGSLNEASASALEIANERGLPWMILHADLPLLRSDDLAPAIELTNNNRWVIAPSFDGGTNLLGGPPRAVFEFAYGPGSFRRHIDSLASSDPEIIRRIGLILDIDHPSDLEAAIDHPLGSWLIPIVG